MEKKRVMVVDDEKDFLSIIRLNLEVTGKYEVMTLSSAKDILSSIHSFKPDIILLDILMPSISGVETCELLNSDSMANNIPIIIVSALDKIEDKRKVYSLGVVDYVQKTADTDELLEKMEKALKFK